MTKTEHLIAEIQPFLRPKSSSLSSTVERNINDITVWAAQGYTFVAVALALAARGEEFKTPSLTKAFTREHGSWKKFRVSASKRMAATVAKTVQKSETFADERGEKTWGEAK